jgi:hypothetical protein
MSVLKKWWRLRKNRSFNGRSMGKPNRNKTAAWIEPCGCFVLYRIKPDR